MISSFDKKKHQSLTATNQDRHTTDIIPIFRNILILLGSLFLRI